MLNFFIKHKKVRGAITVFLTIIYLSMYLMIGVFVDGGRIRMCETTIEDVQQIATENVMSQYNRGLYEYYGLFGLNEKDEDIIKNIQNQINQTIGLNIPEETVKSFIEDVWDKGNQIINGSEEINFRKRFDPYGLKLIDTKVSSIDLTNREALRAQIRDEMRYSAPLVLLANFNKVAEKFMNLSGEADAVEDITSKITKQGESIEKKQSEYYTQIDDFAKTFDAFVEYSYSGKDIKRKTNSAYESTRDEINNTKQGFFENIKHSILSLFNTDKKEETFTENIDQNENSYGDTNMEGYAEVIDINKLVLCDYARKFDEDEWPEGKDFYHIHQVGEDEEGEPEFDSFYSGDCPLCSDDYDHNVAVSNRANSKFTTYENQIKELDKFRDTALTKARNTINVANELMQIIDDLLGDFKAKHDAYEGYDNIQKLYNDSMEDYLRQWNKLSDEKETLEKFANDLEELGTVIENAIESARNKKTQIANLQLDEDWESPYQNIGYVDLYDSQSIIRNDFHNILQGLKDDENGIKNFNTHSENDTLQHDVFELLNYIVDYKDNSQINDLNDDSDNRFNKIKVCEKSDKSLYDAYKESIKNDIDKGNVISKINEIFNKAKEIMSAIPKGLTDNLYDETYILTHCRDYVHTYKYPSLDNKNDSDIDTVLNAKFVMNQSKTKYLTDVQLRENEVTPAEIEYILWGEGSEGNTKNVDTYSNVVIMYSNIFIIRLALNYIAALTSPRCVNESTLLAAATGPFAPAVKFAAPLIYAIPQSILDTEDIMNNCKKVNIYNGSSDLTLYSAIEEIVKRGMTAGKETIEKMSNNLKDSVNNQLEKENELGISIICGIVIDKTSTNQNVNKVAHHLLNDNVKRFVFGDSDNSFDSEESIIENTTLDTSIKAGYTDYLLIYLFVRGIGGLKNSQMDNLMNVIETNMRKAQDDSFRLKDTYAQIGVETKSSIKYIFMTHSLMKNIFNNSKEYEDFAKKYNSFPITTKTSFAY